MSLPGRFPGSEPSSHHSRLSDPVRRSSLSDANLIDTPPEQPFERAVRLVKQVTGAPTSLFSLVDTDRQFFKAQVGLDLPSGLIRETPLSHSFCQYVVGQEEPLGVSDAREHPLLRANKAISDLGVVAYLDVPVRGRRGQVIGSLCAIESSPRQWTEEDLEALRSIAGFVEAEIALRKQVAERQLLIEELNHRVRNLFAIVSGLIRLGRNDDVTLDAFSTHLQDRIQNLATTHHLIQPVPHRAVDDEGEERREVSLKELLDTLLKPFSGVASDRISTSGPFVFVGPVASTYLALAVHEMATNAIKYGTLDDVGGKLSINWSDEDPLIRLKWEEDNPRLELAEDPKKSFGSRLIRTSIEGQLAGHLMTSVEPGHLLYEIELPKAALEI